VARLGIERPRVALGPTELAGTVMGWEEGLRSIGVDVEVVLWAQSPFGYEAGRVVSRLGRVRYALSAPFRRDVFHYQYGSTWLRTLDAWWARLLRRTLVVTYHGDDCRIPSVARERFPARARVVPPDRECWARRRLRALGAVADAALVADLELASYVQPYFRRVYVTPLPLHSDPSAAPAPREPGPPVVLHAASDPLVKGTDTIREAVERVAARVPLEFRLLTGVPYDEVARELQRAEVVVDQLNSVTSGVFALEALRLGVPVLGEYDPQALAPYQRDLPVVRVSPVTLEDELETLVRDGELRRKIGAAGPPYVARNHDPVRVAETLLEIYAHARRSARGSYLATADGVTSLG
jgi:glycosyltransferase involved in cell wall biosynthesis